MPHETRSSYRQIFKATSIFGGLQVYQILLTLVRSKFTAVLLGTHGMGISGLLLSTANLVGSLTNLGLGVSEVRNVSERHAAGDQPGMARVASVLRKLVWLTGLGGAALMVVFARKLLSPPIKNLILSQRNSCENQSRKYDFVLQKMAGNGYLLQRRVKAIGDFLQYWFVEFKLNEMSRLSVADEVRASIKSGDGRGITISLQVSDIEQTRSELMEAGIISTPIKEVWGSKAIYVRDPEGNRLEFWAGRAKA